MNKNNNRYKKSLINHMKKTFKFLVLDYNLVCTNIASDKYICISYESEKIYVRIYYDYNRSYEINTYFGLKNKFAFVTDFLLEEITDLLGLEDTLENKLFQASSDESFKICITKISNIIKTNLVPALEGNIEFYENLSRMYKKKIATFENSRILNHTRDKAQNAWRQKDFKKYIDIYSTLITDDSLIKNLTESEIKKIEYAKKHLTQTSSLT